MMEEKHQQLEGRVNQAFRAIIGYLKESGSARPLEKVFNVMWSQVYIDETSYSACWWCDRVAVGIKSWSSFLTRKLSWNYQQEKEFLQLLDKLVSALNGAKDTVSRGSEVCSLKYMRRNEAYDRRKDVCKYFAKGKCGKATFCPFRHTLQ